MMNAELLKDRMKPKNIIQDVGRDHWDYSNDRVIGTARAWNWNVIQADLRGEEEPDDSLMRASGPINIIDTSGRKTDVTNNLPQDQARVISYADYADLDVLNKEFMLGKGLLLKAIDNITPKYLDSLKEHTEASANEIQLISTLLNLLEALNKSKNFDSLNSWGEVCEHLNSNLINKLDSVSDKIQQRNYNKDQLNQIREEFKIKPGSSNQDDILNRFKEVM